MMNFKLLFALFITAMLFFGCTQQQPPAPAVQPPATPQTPPSPPTVPVVQKDTTPPELTVGLVSETSEASVTLTGVTEAGAFVTVNGAAVDNAAGSFSAKLNLKEGENTIIIVSEDNAKNKNTLTKTVRYTKPSSKFDDTYVPANGDVSTSEKDLYIAVGVTPSDYKMVEGRIESLNLLPGSTSVVTLTLTNFDDTAVHVEFKAAGDAGNMVNPIAPITLFKKGDVRAVPISITVPAGTIFGVRTGTITLVETRAKAS